jgi:hypothetical protein
MFFQSPEVVSVKFGHAHFLHDTVYRARAADGLLYSAFNRGGNRVRSVKPEQHLSRIAGVTADSGMSQQR